MERGGVHSKRMECKIIKKCIKRLWNVHQQWRKRVIKAYRKLLGKFFKENFIDIRDVPFVK